MFGLIKLLFLYKTNTMYTGLTKSAETIRGNPVFYCSLKLFKLSSVLYSSGKMFQILRPGYQVLSIPL